MGTPQSRDLFLEVMERVRRRHRFVVVGYVVMPEHVHLLVQRTGARRSLGSDEGSETVVRTAVAESVFGRG